MTEDHGLADRDGAIDIAQGLILFILAGTLDVELPDVVQRLLLPSQPDDDWVIGDDPLSKLHHRLVIGC